MTALWIGRTCRPRSSKQRSAAPKEENMPSRRDFCQLMLASTAALPALSLASAGTALAQTRANTLRVVRPYDTASLDAVGIGAQRSTWCISLHIYDRLVTYAVTSRPDGTHEYDPAKPTGELAERWDMFSSF